MYDVTKVSYCQTTQEAKDNIYKVFDREFVLVITELKLLIKLGNKYYDTKDMSEVI